MEALSMQPAARAAAPRAALPSRRRSAARARSDARASSRAPASVRCALAAPPKRAHVARAARCTTAHLLARCH